MERILKQPSLVTGNTAPKAIELVCLIATVLCWRRLQAAPRLASKVTRLA